MFTGTSWMGLRKENEKLSRHRIAHCQMVKQKRKSLLLQLTALVQPPLCSGRMPQRFTELVTELLLSSLARAKVFASATPRS